MARTNFVNGLPVRYLPKDARFLKSIESEKQRILQLIDKSETSVKNAYMMFVNTVKSETVMAQVRALLEQNRALEAMRLVDSHIVRFSNVIPRLMIDVGASEVPYLAGVLRADTGGIAIGFNPTDPESTALMRRAQLKFIQDFSSSQRTAVRYALTEALKNGQGTEGAARAFRDAIGLTQGQLLTVERYQQSLEAGTLDSLNRVLRDRRFDASVRAQADGTKVLSAEQIQRMVDRYRDRMLAYRAATISRTETHRTVEQARKESLHQVIRQGGIDQGLVRRRWVAVMDSAVRDTHREMNGQVVGLNEPFKSPSGAILMQPGDPTAPIEETANCRCVVAIDVEDLP